MSIDAVSLIKAFSAYVCSFKLYCLFNTMKDAKIANNIVERLTKGIMREAVASYTVVISRRTTLSLLVIVFTMLQSISFVA